MRTPRDPAYTPRTLPALRAALAANVRRLRQARGWTQEDLSSCCGLDRTCVQAIEAGRSNPTLDTIARLCDALEVEGTALVAASVMLAARRPGRPPSNPPRAA